MRDKGLTSHVEFIGEVTGLVKHAYYRNSDVLCVVSHFESFSLTALEALKYGCAVVATRVGGIPEFIEHEFNGLLVSNGNPNQISAALVRLAKDVQLRHRLVNHGYTTVPRYSMSRMVGEHLEMYESIVMQGPRTTSPRMKDFAYLIRYLHSALRWRLFVWLTLIVLASALEGVTLGLFLPIIAGADSDSPLQRIFTSAFDNLGIQYTLPLALGAMTALYALRTALVITQEIFVARQIAGLMVENQVQDGRPAPQGRLPVLHEARRRVLQQRRHRRVHQSH